VAVADVVVVGGGIGGASLAYALAQGGLGVTVLEASTEYPDRVRGECMVPWGVAEAQKLGVDRVLLDAGAHIAPVWKQYIGGIGDAGDIPASLVIPDVPGSLNLRHPVACQTLADAAAAAGATVVRGVQDVKITAGSSPTVSYAVDGGGDEITTTLVVGADGRASTVRRQTGITLERQDAISYIAGLLVDGLDGVPDDFDVVAGDGDVFMVVFHQGGGRARVYVVVGASQQHRFAGPTGTEKFLAACDVPAFPWSQQVVHGVAAGPCATYPGDDTWTAAPYADGVVLVGDAAGHNDPIIGQGLSITMRDVRTVRDLVLDGARTVAGFAPYGEERMERMERLRFAADLIAVANAEDSDNVPARRMLLGQLMSVMDPGVFPVFFGLFAGPETIPPELVDPATLQRIRNA
jgi:menaquinone-9 beta-reductase